MSDPRTCELDPLAPPPPRIIEDNSHRVGKALRPKGLHTKHLTALERFRVRTLYYDAGLSRDRVHQITGYSKNQIRTAVRAKSAAVGKRPGRPKKFGGVTLSGAGPKNTTTTTSSTSTSSSSSSSSSNCLDEEAELIQQAQNALAREGYMLTGRDRDSNNGGEEEDAEEDDDEDDETDRLLPDTPSGASMSIQASLQSSSVPVADASALPYAGRVGFNDLPPDVRVSIWRCVLSTSSTQIAHSRSWAVEVLPREPWLELGVSPPDIKLENSPWSDYVNERHVPATILSRVNREARTVALERCTPIVVSRAIRDSSKGSPVFVWIDRISDVVHFYGGPFRAEIFDLAGRCACPELYRKLAE
ncbi:hypothetical protein GGS21DRAFT_110756 [Xylaria nigripes]|nr:hypothetical protein GGS21DRAFT_110756 [Xylaria nigripes]